jgi:hypothetical protein
MILALSSGMATTRQRCIELAKRLNVTIHESNGEINLEAPRGFAWDGDTHELVNSPWDAQTTADQWEAAYKQMQDCTLRPCTVADCDWCNPSEENR